MAITTDRQPTQWEAPRPPGEPPQPSRRSYAIAAVIALVVGLIVVVVGVGVLHHPKAKTVTGTGGGSPQTTAPANSAPPPSNTATTVIGPSGNPASWPAAQPIPPSLAVLTTDKPDLVAMTKTLLTYRDWVYSHPNPSLVDTYMLSDSQDYQAEKQQLATLASRGWHANPKPAEVDFLKVTLAPRQQFYSDGRPVIMNGHTVWFGGSVTMVFNSVASTYLDSSGNVVQQRPAAGQAGISWIIRQGTDGRWRIGNETRLNPPGGISQLEQP